MGGGNCLGKEDHQKCRGERVGNVERVKKYQTYHL